MSRDFSGIKFYADSTKSPLAETIHYKLSTCKKITYNDIYVLDVKDPVVHVTCQSGGLSLLKK